ncbi:Uncharacterized protein Rs2_07564 [Raphanus sativus]|nr:Uncharacterized protein Rs2_07564 [Raphanus sativus]
MASSSITSSDHRLKRRLKPLSLRDYLLDDLSSCSSNGFKSFPRRQSSTLRRLLDAEIKRSRVFHRKRRYNCGLACSHAVQKASTALLSAVKLLPFPSSSVEPPAPSRKKGTRNLWNKLSHRELNNGEIERRRTEGREQKIRRGRSLTFGDFLKESLDEPYNVSFSGEEELSDAAGDSTSDGSELLTNSEVTQSSGESNDAVGDETEETRNRVVVMMSGDCVGSRVKDNSEECVNEEKEQLGPISILECPFQDVVMTPDSHQKETNEKKLLRKSRRFESLVQLEPVDLEKRIEENVERQDYDSHHMVETEEDQSENRVNRLFALVKSTLTEEPNHLLVSQKVDKLLLDFFKEDRNIQTRNEDMLVKIAGEMGNEETRGRIYVYELGSGRDERDLCEGNEMGFYQW